MVDRARWVHRLTPLGVPFDVIAELTSVHDAWLAGLDPLAATVDLADPLPSAPAGTSARLLPTSAAKTIRPRRRP